MNQKLKLVILPVLALSMSLGALSAAAEEPETIQGSFVLEEIFAEADHLGFQLTVTVWNDTASVLTNAVAIIHDPNLPSDIELSLGSIAPGDDGSASGFIAVSTETYQDWVTGLPAIADINYVSSNGAQTIQPLELTCASQEP